MRIEVAKRTRLCTNCRNVIVKGEACLVDDGAAFHYKKNLCEVCLKAKVKEVEDYNADFCPYHEDEKHGS